MSYLPAWREAWSSSPSAVSWTRCLVKSAHYSRQLQADRDNRKTTKVLPWATFQHGEKHDHHLLLQFHELAQQLQLVGVLGQLVLHVGEDVEEPAHSVPQSAVSQSQLVEGARALQQSTLLASALLGRASNSQIIITLITAVISVRRCITKKGEYIYHALQGQQKCVHKNSKIIIYEHNAVFLTHPNCTPTHRGIVMG